MNEEQVIRMMRTNQDYGEHMEEAKARNLRAYFLYVFSHDCTFEEYEQAEHLNWQLITRRVLDEWQGFSNQETWLAWLWTRESLVARQVARNDGARALRVWALEEVPDSVKESMFDFVHAALDRVDYDELTEHLAETKPPEEEAR